MTPDSGPPSWPPWVQQAEIDRAREVCRRWGREIVLVMCVHSLPRLLCHRPLARALHRSDAATLGRLVVDSVQSIFDVVVRLDPEPSLRGWGKAIDQETLAGALTALAVWNLEGLDKLGIGLSKEDKEATLTVWRVIGSLLGLDESLLPADLAEAGDLVNTIERRHFARSTTSVILVRRHLSTVRGFLPWHLKAMPLHLMRLLMKPELASMLDVPRRLAVTPFAIRLLFALRGHGDELRVPRQTVRYVGGRLIRRVIAARRAGHEERGGPHLPQPLRRPSVSDAGKPPGLSTPPCERISESCEWRPGIDARADLAEINGGSTYFEELGEGGTPLVFVHGLGLDHSYWHPQMEYFAPWRRVFAYDTRGHGRSTTESNTGLDFEQLVDDLRQVITTFGLGRPVIVGHSTGGVICVRMAIKYAGSISGLVLLDTPDADRPSTGPFASPWLRTGLRLVDLLRPGTPGIPFAGMCRRAFFSKRFISTRGEAVACWERQFRGNSPRAILAALRAQARLRPVTPLLSGIEVPMLGFWGTEDQACPRWPMDRYVARIPNADPLQRVRGSGHMTLTEEPEVISQGIDEFLKGHAL